MVSPEAAILRVLIQGEGYGLELTRRVREWTNGKLMLGDESFYQAVQVLEEQGLVESYMSESASGVASRAATTSSPPPASVRPWKS
jgi:DNA-binding PadR family transcriptional regulator